MEPKTEWKYKPGNWVTKIKEGELEDLGSIDLETIGLPWAYNVHIHINYDRLFWDVWERGVKTPLLLRPWSYPFKGARPNFGCNPDGSRRDNTPIIYSSGTQIKYELIIGNLRYVAARVCGYTKLPCLILNSRIWNDPVEEIWKEYHPVFEGNWYDHPDHTLKSGGTVYVKG